MTTISFAPVTDPRELAKFAAQSGHANKQQLYTIEVPDAEAKMFEKKYFNSELKVDFVDDSSLPELKTGRVIKRPHPTKNDALNYYLLENDIIQKLKITPEATSRTIGAGHPVLYIVNQE